MRYVSELTRQHHTSHRLQRSSRVSSRPILAAGAAQGGRLRSSSPGLSVPTAHSGGEDPLAASHAKARYGPPPGFGYPLDGLLPLPPRRACFVPTALLGFIPSKCSPPTRWRSRFRESRTRVPLASTRSPAGRTERTGAPRTDFRALAPASVPGCPRVISPRLAGCSPGIFPFQGLRRPPRPHFRAALPSRAWPGEARRPRRTCASGCRSATDWPDSAIPTASHGDARPDNLPRVRVPACSRQVRNADAPGYGFTSSATGRHHPASRILGAVSKASRPEPCGINLGHSRRW